MESLLKILEDLTGITPVDSMAALADEVMNDFTNDIDPRRSIVYDERRNYITDLRFTSIEFDLLREHLLLFKDLEFLIFENCRCHVLDFNFSGLSKLTQFSFTDSKIKVIDPKFQLPASVLELSLRNNKIRDVSDLNISACPQLELLDLSHNQIEILPNRFFRHSKLEEKHDTAVLKKAWKRDISLTEDSNDFKLYPKDFGGSLFLYGNPLIFPPLEFMDNTFGDLRNYMDQVLEDSASLNEIKTIFVGDGASGKTSLLKSIKGDEFNEFEPQTHGINISSIKFIRKGEKYKINLWDFGGQQIMHATHQFFLSQRSLYVVVVDCRKDSRIEYWLKHISSFGGNSPIIVVINKIDENPGYRLNQRFLKEKYPNIHSFYRVSCKTKEGLKEFTKALKDASSKVEILKSLWNKKWLTIKKKIEASTDNFISFSEFRKICVKNNVKYQSHQNLLIQVLHDLGVVLNFKDFDLADTNVINPHWLTEGIYKIINSRILSDHGGVFKNNDFHAVLNPQIYPREKYHYLKSIMEKFQICYKIDNQSILVPDLLPVEEPEIYVEEELQTVFIYDFLPKSILPRLIVQFHQYIYDNLKWRSGVVLSHPLFDAYAIIKEDFEEKRIKVSLAGKYRRSFFSIINDAIQRLNSEFTNLECDTRIILTGKSPATKLVSVSYENLVFQESAGVSQFIPDGLKSFVNVKQVLGYVQSDENEAIEIKRELVELQKLIKTMSREEAETRLDKYLLLKPSIMGLGVDLNAIIEGLRKRIKKKKE
ncbi:MAG: COR domain-containing protein [Bacteroidota bacterium]